MNRTTIIGRLGKDPETGKAGTDKQYAKFSVAVDRYGGKDDQGKVINKTTWFNCTAFGKTAAFIVKYAKKGSLVYVEGEHVEEEFEGKKYWKLMVSPTSSAFELLEWPKGERPAAAASAGAAEASSAEAGASSSPAAAPAEATGIADQDVPF